MRVIWGFPGVLAVVEQVAPLAWEGQLVQGSPAGRRRPTATFGLFLDNSLPALCVQYFLVNLVKFLLFLV